MYIFSISIRGKKSTSRLLDTISEKKKMYQYQSILYTCYHLKVRGQCFFFRNTVNSVILSNIITIKKKVSSFSIFYNVMYVKAEFSAFLL